MSGIYVYSRRRCPRPAGSSWWWAVFLAAALLGVVSAAVVSPARAAEETPRYTPDSHGSRPTVLARAEVADLAGEVFGPALAGYVTRVVLCESSYRPGARSAGWDRVFGWYDHRGLMQIAAHLWTDTAVELTGSDDLYDPYVNLVTGREIQRRQGWSAWPVCGR